MRDQVSFSLLKSALFYCAKSSLDQNSEYFPITCQLIASQARSLVSHFEHCFERVFFFIFIFCLILFLTQLEIENVALLAQLIGCRRSGRFIFKNSHYVPIY